MSFGLVTAINIEDVPLLMRTAARNYHTNAERGKGVILEHTHLRAHHPELWTLAAQMLEEMAAKLDVQIKEIKSHAPTKVTKRAVL